MNTLVRTRRTQISPEPRATCLADERRADGRLGKKRDGCFAMVLELLRKGRARGGLGVGKVPPNVLEVSQKENSDVGRDPGS